MARSVCDATDHKRGGKIHDPHLMIISIIPNRQATNRPAKKLLSYVQTQVLRAILRPVTCDLSYLPL